MSIFICLFLISNHTKINIDSPDIVLVEKAIELDLSWHNMSAEFSFSIETYTDGEKDAPDDKKNHVFFLYNTQEIKKYVHEFSVVNKKDVFFVHKQALWQNGLPGYRAEWITKNNKTESPKSIDYWKSTKREAYDIISRHIDIWGLWEDWQGLPMPLGEYLKSNIEKITSRQIEGNSSVIQCELITEWGIILIQGKRISGKMYINNIILTKFENSLYTRESGKPFPNKYGILNKQSSIYNFVYVADQIARINYSFDIDLTNNGKRESGKKKVQIDFRQLHFAGPEILPPDIVQPRMKELPNGTRVTTTFEELQPIAMEWQNDRVVKSIDKKALNTAEEIKYRQDADSLKNKSRLYWYIGGSIVVIAFALVVVNKRRSMK